MESEKPTKINPKKATKELLKRWIDENDCENIVIIGLHSAGGWKYGFTTSEFEFLAACEGVVQKLKFNALKIAESK